MRAVSIFCMSSALSLEIQLATDLAQSCCRIENHYREDRLTTAIDAAAGHKVRPIYA